MGEEKIQFLQFFDYQDSHSRNKIGNLSGICYLRFPEISITNLIEEMRLVVKRSFSSRQIKIFRTFWKIWTGTIPMQG